VEGEEKGAEMGPNTLARTVLLLLVMETNNRLTYLKAVHMAM